MMERRENSKGRAKARGVGVAEAVIWESTVKGLGDDARMSYLPAGRLPGGHPGTSRWNSCVPFTPAAHQPRVCVPGDCTRRFSLLSMSSQSSARLCQQHHPSLSQRDLDLRGDITPSRGFPHLFCGTWPSLTVHMSHCLLTPCLLV